MFLISYSSFSGNGSSCSSAVVEAASLVPQLTRDDCWVLVAGRGGVELGTAGLGHGWGDAGRAWWAWGR
ncbi:hypothetical protein E2C01_071924 [Portunus trituberculatus]|uniref:Uncharacterized protein n=1 Tax=Portunus trituberculatus TaxID=210409 RepID=A0A5B7HYB6_PORTR|nr:hypothetical protein [Portunus trituberculatus]